jgi:small-conductance mechanosensitive channel
LPGLSPRIDELDRTAPEQSGAFVERLGRRVHEVESQTEDDPELRALRMRELEAGMEVFEAMRSLRASFDRGDTSREEVVEALAVKLGAHFDARLAVTRHEVERLRERLARMEGELESMGDRRAAEVERMTDRMLSARGRDMEGPTRRGTNVKPDRP